MKCEKQCWKEMVVSSGWTNEIKKAVLVGIAWCRHSTSIQMPTRVLSSKLMDLRIIQSWRACQERRKCKQVDGIVCAAP